MARSFPTKTNMATTGRSKALQQELHHHGVIIALELTAINQLAHFGLTTPIHVHLPQLTPLNHINLHSHLTIHDLHQHDNH
jgi:hypothetical protein